MLHSQIIMPNINNIYSEHKSVVTEQNNTECYIKQNKKHKTKLTVLYYHPVSAMLQ